MTIARKEIVISGKEAIYHCISRCVRRAFLCGYDRFSGNSYDHRKMWIKKRIQYLSDIFVIDICGYSVMSNHLHIILRTRPDLIEEMTPENIAKRWYKLFPKRRKKNGMPEEPTDVEISAIVNNESKLNELQERLGSISWLMRCINEYIAKLSNNEDKCKGRFWEGRFSCQRILDEAGLLACMTYVDLNPVRARAELTPEESTYTSGCDRIKAKQAKEKLRILERRDMLNKPSESKENNKRIEIEIKTSKSANWLNPIEKSKDKKGLLSISLDEYIEILDITGREIREGSKGYIPSHLKPIFQRLEINEEKWVKTVKSYGSLFYRVSGKVDSIAEAAKEAGRSWLKGLSVSKQVFKVNLASEKS